MSRAKALEALRAAKEGKRNAPWFAGRALHLLPRGVEPDLVAPAMTLLAGLGALLPHLRKLPPEYEPLARRTFQAHADSPEARFVTAWKGTLREAGEWLHQLQMVHDRRSSPRLSKLLGANAVEAAQATVAAVGLRAPRLLAVLAAEGSASSADVVLPLAVKALERRDDRLDVLRAWVSPFARGPHFAALVRELDGAVEARGASSPLVAWAERLGARRPKSVHFEVSAHSRDARWSAWVRLQSTRLPHHTVSVSGSKAYFACEDGHVRHAAGLKLAPPSLDELPAWLARVGARLGVKWNPTPRWMLSSLRGKARAAALAWLFPEERAGARART